MSGTPHLIVVTAEDGNEAVYFGGELKMSDETVYACDIAHIAGDNIIQFSHVVVKRSIETWPKRFEELLIE